MTEVKQKTRNCSIDIFRYICAVMVVAIHTQPFSDITNELGYIFTQIVPRIGVPFFFAVSGYFYIQKLEKKQNPFFSYLKRLLATYFIWSCLYYMINFIQCQNLNLKEFIVNCVYQFVITGSFYHFWFFPALIFSVCLTTVMFRIKCDKAIIPLSVILYTIGCMGCAYHKIGVAIPILGNLFTLSEFDLIRRILLMGFPFFVCGYIVYKLKEKFLNYITNKHLLVCWFVTFVIWLAEICIVRVLAWQTNIVLTFGLYLLVITTLLVLLKNPLPQLKTFSNISRVLANFTFYSHPLCIICLILLSKNILHINITATPMFFLTVGLTFIGGLIIYKWDNKWMNYIIK